MPAAPEETFAFLARLDNHWRLTGRWLDVVRLDSGDGDGDGGAVDGGAVRVHGPLGVPWRLVRTRVLHADPPRLLRGTADVGGSTRASVSWWLSPAAGGTLVRLEARVERLGRFDRALWTLGGRRWMQARFAGVLRSLAERLGGGDPIERL